MPLSQLNQEQSLKLRAASILIQSIIIHMVIDVFWLLSITSDMISCFGQIDVHSHHSDLLFTEITCGFVVIIIIIIIIIIITIIIIEGSLEVKLPTVWRDEKQTREVESEERRYNCRKSEERRYTRAKC